MLDRPKAVVLLAAAALAAAVTPSSASSAVHRLPARRLLAYLWASDHGLLRPYVKSVTITGGHTVTANGRRRLSGATANIGETLPDDPRLVGAARHMCATVAADVLMLHLQPTIAAVRVWSVEGDPVARC